MNKIPQSVISSTRRRSFQEHKNVAGKTVSFDRNVLVFEVEQTFSDEEREEMFYTDEDVRSFRNEIWNFQELCRDGFSQQRSSAPASAQEEDDDDDDDNDTSPTSYNGLEGFLHPERKMKHRLQGVLSVLMEQERQFREQGLFTPVDFDSMSHFYHMASKESQEEAHQRALTHRKVVSEAA